MKFSTYQGEKSVSELTRRLFDIKGRKSEELRKQAEAALLRANPHLAKFGNVPAGMPIVVPDVPGIESTDTGPAAALGEDILDQVRRTLVGAQAAVERSISSQTQEIEASKELVKHRLLKDLGRQTPELEKRLSQITDAAKARQKEIAAFKASSAEDLGQLQKDFAQFSG